MTEINSGLAANELSTEQTELVNGGAMPDYREGYIIYQVKSGDNLTNIAKAYKCTVNDLLKWNPQITDKNRIYTGDYIYIKK